jgi:hypothetical protein
VGENKRGNSARATRRGVLAVASALTLDMAAAFFARPALAEPADERPMPGDLLVPVDVAGAALEPHEFLERPGDGERRTTQVLELDTAEQNAEQFQASLFRVALATRGNLGQSVWQ